MSANSWYSFEKVRDYQIVNLYDAVGRKYRTIYYTNMRTVATDYNEIAYYTYDTDSIEYQKIDYLGNIICTRTKVDTVITDKQKIFNATGYYADGRYYHYVKNHLGSICLVIDSETDSVLQNTYYSASGVPSSTNLDVQPYLYNGKEFIEAYGLNEYDSQARMYYAPIMRTTTMDPMAESYYHISPYSWCRNNPIAIIDPDGRVVIDIQGHNVDEYRDSDLKEMYRNQDWVRFVDADGNVRIIEGKPQEICFGKEGTIKLVEKNDQYTIFSTEGDEAGTKLFEFMTATEGAEPVEWSHLKTGNDESGLNYIGTDWLEHKTSIARRIANYYPISILRSQIHNHPLSTLEPTGLHDKKDKEGKILQKAGTWGDIFVKNITISEYGTDVVFMIYGLDPKTNCYRYNVY